jgi:serine/tyrosine/threonine adenylyltransferase
MFNWIQKQTPILQLGSDFYDSVQAAVFPQKKLRYWNSSMALNLEKDRLWDFKPLENNIPHPLALRYHGHQFQHYNPDLGDGRGFLYAQFNINDQWFDLGTKGSGTTPYSRRGDGRLTLKGAFREALATEMLQSLGVTTSKTMAFFETGENLERGDEPSPTRSAVLTRFSKGHIRIGTFQRLAFFRQIENIKKLTSYSLFFYYPDEYARIDTSDENLVAACFLQNVVKANADLVAQVMMAGFVHGVLNTDNINISGELFDYGPYRFLPDYDPNFTAAYFDQQGLYCYGRQPMTFLWNLNQLAQSLKPAFPNLPTDEILNTFSEQFNERVHFHFLRRLNIKSRGHEQDHQLLAAFFSFMDSEKLFFENTFFQFHSGRIPTNFQAQNTEAFKALASLLEKYEVADSSLSNHPYYQNEKPCTLLIDEIEAIWKPIAENDDWSLFETKLHSIRSIR